MVFPNNYCLSAITFGRRYSQCSTVCGSIPKLGNLGSTVVSGWLAYALKREMCPARRRVRWTASRRVEAARQSADHENVLCSAVTRGGSVSVRRMSALTAAKDTDLEAPSIISAACLAHASSLPAIPWWPSIQSRVDLLARFLSVIGAALDRDWLSVHMAAAWCDGKRHSNAFSSSYDEVIAAPRCCFVRRIVEMTGSPSVTIVLAPPLSAPAVAVKMMNQAFRCLRNERWEVVSSWEPGGARLSVCLIPVTWFFPRTGERGVNRSPVGKFRW